ncbi:MAG TPA: hypothetical protein VI854_05455, partial [Acidimicrobiia bacterium]|nr:hypothetical protein [Acidimicrobiia bacterium]
CGPRAPCAVRVVADAAIPRVSAGMTFSSGPAARYDAGRVALGIAIAGLLLALAAGLVRRTDWSGPAEAATPAMDSAVLDS